MILSKRERSILKGEPVSRYVTVFTDASYCQHTHIAAWAVWIKHSTPAVTERLSGVIYGVRGSHNAEVQALCKAIDFLEQHAAIVFGAKIIIQSDCHGAHESVRKAAHGLKDIGALDVSLRWVKAHQGSRCARSAVNEWCDRQARKLMRAERDKHLAPLNLTSAYTHG